MTVVIKYVREFSEYKFHIVLSQAHSICHLGMILVINGALTHINKYWIVETHILILRESAQHIYLSDIRDTVFIFKFCSF